MRTRKNFLALVLLGKSTTSPPVKPAFMLWLVIICTYSARWFGSIFIIPWCDVALLWCGVAHYGAAWLIMVRRGSVMVRRGSEWCGVAQYVAA